MSKIGFRKISIPQGVQVENLNGTVKVTGPKGAQEMPLYRNLTMKIEGESLGLTRSKEDKETKSMHGLTQRLIGNMIIGVTEGFEKKLDFKGVGFRAEVSGNKLVLNVGFSHPVEVIAPEGISFKVEKNVITVAGSVKQQVGQIAAEIRRIRPVEPYKGKGIKYIDEVPRRKPGKAAKAAVGGTAA